MLGVATQLTQAPAHLERFIDKPVGELTQAFVSNLKLTVSDPTLKDEFIAQTLEFFERYLVMEQAEKKGYRYVIPNITQILLGDFHVDSVKIQGITRDNYKAEEYFPEEYLTAADIDKIAELQGPDANADQDPQVKLILAKERESKRKLLRITTGEAKWESLTLPQRTLLLLEATQYIDSLRELNISDISIKFPFFHFGPQGSLEPIEITYNNFKVVVPPNNASLRRLLKLIIIGSLQQEMKRAQENFDPSKTEPDTVFDKFVLSLHKEMDPQQFDPKTLYNMIIEEFTFLLGRKTVANTAYEDSFTSLSESGSSTSAPDPIASVILPPIVEVTEHAELAGFKVTASVEPLEPNIFSSELTEVDIPAYTAEPIAAKFAELDLVGFEEMNPKDVKFLLEQIEIYAELCALTHSGPIHVLVLRQRLPVPFLEKFCPNEYLTSKEQAEVSAHAGKLPSIVGLEIIRTYRKGSREFTPAQKCKLIFDLCERIKEQLSDKGFTEISFSPPHQNISQHYFGPILIMLYK